MSAAWLGPPAMVDRSRSSPRMGQLVSAESFQKFFAAFGSIEEAVVMRDRSTGMCPPKVNSRVNRYAHTGASRGFGFVTFTRKADAESVLQSKAQLELDGSSSATSLSDLLLQIESSIPRQVPSSPTSSRRSLRSWQCRELNP